MKKIAKSTCIIIGFILLSSGLTGCFTTSAISGGIQYSNPDWAPEYYPGVRYYYLPDIETYYDLSNQDFVYLDNGQWLFSNTLPSMYSGYNLYNGYEIALDIDVFQPWMHHHLYLSNYPRYYYHSVYNNSEIGNIRGFNENVKTPFYITPADRTRNTQLSRNNKALAIPKITRQPQQPNYYGKNIGRPVKVQSQMRRARQVTQPQRNSGGNQQRGNQGGNRGNERH